MAILNTCCGCLTVESGTTLVGLFSFLTSAITFIGILPNSHPANFQNAIKSEVGITGLRNNYPLGDASQLSLVATTVLIAVNMVSSLLLLLGVRHRNRFLLLPWIIWTGLSIALGLVWIILTTRAHVVDLQSVLLYLWAELCVVSHYQNIKDGIREGILIIAPPPPPSPVTGAAADDAEAAEALQSQWQQLEGGNSSSSRRQTAALYVYPTTISDHQGTAGSSGPGPFPMPTGYRSILAISRGGIVNQYIPSALGTNQNLLTGGEGPFNDPPPPYPGELSTATTDGCSNDRNNARTKSTSNDEIDATCPPPAYEDCVPSEDVEVKGT